MNNRWLFSRALLFTLLCVSISACQEEDEDDQYIGIYEYAVYGSNENNESLTIDPAIDNGEFDILAAFSKPESGYDLRLYFSDNYKLDDAVKLYEQSCKGSENLNCYTQEYFDLRCNLSNSLEVSCKSQNHSLTPIVSEIPYTAYLVLEVCVRRKDKCATSFKRVSLR